MQSGRRIKQGRFVCWFVSPAFRWFRRVLRNRTLVWHVKIPTAPLRKFKPQISPKVGNYRLSLPGSWFFAGLALCLKALLFLLEQLVEFDKKGAEFLRILLCGHLCRKLHQSFSLFALQMRFSSRPPPAPGTDGIRCHKGYIYSVYGIEPSFDAVRTYEQLWRSPDAQAIGRSNTRIVCHGRNGRGAGVGNNPLSAPIGASRTH